VNRTREA